ncbi:MAG: phosphotransferase, partial [Zavarzinia sp.]|nr:phosphotransferase [Zavarzinia sp.]
LTYLDGVPLSSTAPGKAQARAIGLGLGRLDRALADFEHPAAHRALLWDAGHVDRVRPLVDHLADAADRAFIHELIDAFETHTAPRLAGLRAQVIHNDLNPHNVLVDSADPARLAGIIDVGDALAAPLVVDLGTALAYRMGTGDLDEICAFAAGFNEIMALSPAEVALLPDLMRTRMILTVVITAWRAALEPGNRDYILRNNSRAWRGLREMAAIAPGMLADRLHGVMERGTR